MFIEPNLKVSGAWMDRSNLRFMFSSKTEELIRRLKRWKLPIWRLKFLNQAIDTRYDETNIVSHDTNVITSTR